jgi:hypothetical protein
MHVLDEGPRDGDAVLLLHGEPTLARELSSVGCHLSLDEIYRDPLQAN